MTDSELTPPVEEQKATPFWKRKFWKLPVWGWGIIGVLLIGAIAGGSTDEEQDEETSDTAVTQPQDQAAVTSPDATTAGTPVPATEPEATTSTTTSTTSTTTTTTTTTTTVAPTTTEAPLPIISAGTYIVGAEIPVGIYRVSGYWARLDSDLEIIENDGVYSDSGLGILTVLETDSFIEISGEAVDIAEIPVYDPMVIAATDGTYLVGIDIQPGRYRISDPEFAYAARLTVTGDIIDNEGNAGNVIIDIAATDFAFTFSGELEQI